MELTATTFVVIIAGLSFAFSAHLLQLFVFMFVVYGALVPLDIFTRVRVERCKHIIGTQKTNVRSGAMRDGLLEKVLIMIMMLVMAIIVYFVNGTFGDGGTCAIACITASMIVNIFMALFLVSEFASVIENMIDYSELKKTPVNPVVRLLGRMLGIVYKTLQRKLEVTVNNNLKNDNGNR